MAIGGLSKIFAHGDGQRAWEKTGHHEKLFIGLSILMLLVLGVVGYFLYQKYFIPDAVVSEPIKNPAPSTTETTLTKMETSAALETIPLFSDANYKSENFYVGDIAIGGEAEFLLSEDSPGAFEISAIRGEAFTEKNKPEVKLVLSWKTNKLAKSGIEYSKGVGQAKKTIEEDSYSLNHSLIIPGLDQASTYVYAITSNDRFGNTVTSDSHAVYTGSRTVSLFDLIAGAIGDVFGWAVNKK